MSITTNLELNKHDNPSTNEDEFDVENYLNVNWDKIDEFAGDKNSDILILKDKDTELANGIEQLEENISNIQEEQEEQNNNIEELQQQLQELQEENENLKNALPTISGTGTNITLNNTSKNKFKKFEVGGNTEQTQLSGKNLFNPNGEILNAYVNPNPTNPSIVADNNNRVAILQVKPNTQYSLYGTQIPITSVADDWYMLVCTEKPTIGTSGRLIGNSSAFSTTFSTNENENWIALKFANITKTNMEETLKTIQLEEGSTATSYEPYCGGIPSPNPEYKQDIQNVTGTIVNKISNKNWFDESVLDEYKNDEDDEAWIFNNSALYNKNLTPNVKFKENTAYTIQYIAKQTTGNPRLIIVYTDGTTQPVGNDIIATSHTKYTQVSNSLKTIDYITSQYSVAGTKSFYIKKNSLMIEEGSTATDYVEHQEQNLPFTLTSGQKLMLGDSLTDDEIHHKRKQVVFDGSEDEAWEIRSDTHEMRINLGANAKYNSTIFANRLKQVNAHSATGDNIRWVANSTIICIASQTLNTAEMTLDQWKSYLQSNNLVIEFGITEETETYNETQQEQYNAIKEAMSYYEQTNIKSTSEEVGPIIDAEAIADMNSLLSDLETRLLTLESEV